MTNPTIPLTLSNMQLDEAHEARLSHGKPDDDRSTLVSPITAGKGAAQEQREASELPILAWQMDHAGFGPSFLSDYSKQQHSGYEQFSRPLTDHVAAIAALLERDKRIAELKQALAAERKAVEFAEYLAKRAEQFIAAVNRFHDASAAMIEQDGIESAEEALDQATEAVAEFSRSLESKIYEFRKRIPARGESMLIEEQIERGRTAFEAALRKTYPLLTLEYEPTDNHYLDPEIDMGWWAWQAAAQPQEVERPSPPRGDGIADDTAAVQAGYALLAGTRQPSPPEPPTEAATQIVGTCSRNGKPCGDAPERWCVECPQWTAPAAQQPQPSTSEVERLKHDDDLRYVRHVLEAGKAMTDADQRAAMVIIHGLRTAALEVPIPARKVGGSYQANGYVIARFQTRTGLERVVFEFAEPAGLLHIFDAKQVQPRAEQAEVPSAEAAWEPMATDQLLKVCRGVVTLDDSHDDAFCKGARFAEQYHGIFDAARQQDQVHKEQP